MRLKTGTGIMGVVDDGRANPGKARYEMGPGLSHIAAK